LQLIPDTMMLRSVTLVGAKALPSIGIVNRCAIESVTAVPLKALKATIRRTLRFVPDDSILEQELEARFTLIISMWVF